MKKAVKNIIIPMLAILLLCACGQVKEGEKVEEPVSITPPVTEDEEESYEERLLYFSEPSGFYDAPISLEMICSDKDASIYYTLDGTVPDENSTLYREALTLRDASKNNDVYSRIGGANPSGDYFPASKVMKGNVIRAAALFSDGTWSEVTDGTFFIGIDRSESFADAPVISMLTDPDNLFDYEKGIYVMGKSYDDWIEEDARNRNKQGWEKFGNFAQKGRDWERPADIEYMPAEGEGFSVSLGIRIMGAASRRNMQKSFRLICRSDYGYKNIKRVLIPGNERSDGSGEVDKYKSFLLRDGGNDCDYCKLRDPLLQDLVKNRSFETQASAPAVLFINGEYWGMYALTEDYSENYIENNYGIDSDNVIIVKRGEIDAGNDEDIELFYKMRDFIIDSDLSDDSAYEIASSLLDMTSFAEYCAFNIYINNEDSFFKDNNWQMWRVRSPFPEIDEADGKWRMMAYDTEYSTGLYNDGNGYGTDSLKAAITSNAYGGRMLRSLCENEEFRKLFIRALCDMRNIDFETERVKTALVKWDSLYKDLVPDTLRRFGPEWVIRWNDPVQYYGEKVREVEKWLTGRYKSFPDQVKKYFDLDEPVTVSISSSDPEKGGFFLNTGSNLMTDYEAEVFKEAGILLSAEPLSGSFDHWEVENGRVLDESQPVTEIYPEEGCIIRACFK